MNLVQEIHVQDYVFLTKIHPTNVHEFVILLRNIHSKQLRFLIYLKLQSFIAVDICFAICRVLLGKVLWLDLD